MVILGTSGNAPPLVERAKASDSAGINANRSLFTHHPLTRGFITQARASGREDTAKLDIFDHILQRDEKLRSPSVASPRAR